MDNAIEEIKAQFKPSKPKPEGKNKKKGKQPKDDAVTFESVDDVPVDGDDNKGKGDNTKGDRAKGDKAKGDKTKGAGAAERLCH